MCDAIVLGYTYGGKKKSNMYKMFVKAEQV